MFKTLAILSTILVPVVVKSSQQGPDDFKKKIVALVPGSDKIWVQGNLPFYK